MATVTRTSWLALSDVELNALYSVLNRVDIVGNDEIQETLNGITYELDDTAEDLNIEVVISDWSWVEADEDKKKEGQ